MLFLDGNCKDIFIFKDDVFSSQKDTKKFIFAHVNLFQNQHMGCFTPNGEFIVITEPFNQKLASIQRRKTK